MRLRDTALDIGDHTLAARAQAFVARLQPDALEYEILGAIYATGGDLAAADVAFRAGLAIEPDHAGSLVRLRAARTGTFAPYQIARGFGSPANRQFTRGAQDDTVPRRTPPLLARTANVEV